MPENTIICRCEDLTLKEVRDWIAQGYTTVEEIKRVSRIGMGPCQGSTCRDHLLRELAKVNNKTIEEMEPGVVRPPATPVKLETFARGDLDD